MIYRISPQVHYRSVDGEVILLDGRGDTYLGLNKTGSVIWETIAQGGSVKDAAQALVKRFDVAPDRSVADVQTLVDQLVENGLIQIADS